MKMIKKYAKISILMPSRYRLKKAQNFINSLEQTSKYPENIEVLIFIDDDDHETKKIRSDKIKLKLFFGPQTSMGFYNSYLLSKAEGSIIMLGNDDIVAKTIHWDIKVLEIDYKYEDKIYLTFPNDLFKGKSNSCFPIISKKTASLLQCPYPTQYTGGFIDSHIFEIFIRLKNLGFDRINYLNEIVFEHLHFRSGKSQVDKVYKERNRFEGDNQFHSLVDLRKKQTKILYNYLMKNKINIELTIDIFNVKEHKLYDIFRLYVNDEGLAFSWKLKKFLYYSARKLYSSLPNIIKKILNY